MLKSLQQELQNERLFPTDARLVVGVSGGPDSMALLHLLLQLNEQAGWQLKLHVAHVNHLLRGAESEKDAAFVQAAADSFALPCTIEAREIAALADAESVGIEEFGRQQRYAFFERVCLQVGAKYVAVAHHADDNAETILFRVLRGTGLRGLAGIPRSRTISPASVVRVVRPLLRRTRATILQYLSDEGIAYREDRSNDANEAMRNRIRNLVLPQIETQINPQVRDALARLGEQAAWLEEFLRETVQKTFETLIISHTDQFITLNAEAMARKSRIVQTELVRLAYRTFGLGEQDLSFGHLVGVVDLMGDSGSGKQVKLPGGMTVEKRYHELVFSLPTDEPRELIAAEIAVHLPGRTILPIRKLAIDCAIEEVCMDVLERRRSTGGRYLEFVDLDAVHPPLVIRKRRPGDRFFPLGAPGSKKVSDFLIDRKVKPLERNNIAVLCDQLGPIWIVGHRIDDRVKLTSMTRKVLKLSATPLSL
jgi:tRNA(Ile)-lysidine synthase